MARQFTIAPPELFLGDLGRTLRPLGLEARWLATYLMITPHSLITGIYPLPHYQVAADTGIDSTILDDLYAELDRVDYARYDPAQELVFVVPMVKYQLLPRRSKEDREAGRMSPSDNQVKALKKLLEALPSRHPYVLEFVERYGNTALLRNGPNKAPVRDQAFIDKLIGADMPSGKHRMVEAFTEDEFIDEPTGEPQGMGEDYGF